MENEAISCAIRLLPIPKGATGFYDDYEHSSAPRLAMRGAPARAIKNLADHSDLATAPRYVHLSPAAVEARCDCSIHRKALHHVFTETRKLFR